jgi:hypothetical protein
MRKENEKKYIPLLHNREEKSSKISLMENNTTSIIDPMKMICMERLIVYQYYFSFGH